MSKRIAIIGSGISGLTSAYLLSRKHQITLFEANSYLGGHTHTVDFTLANQVYAIDTGFIVFNQENYPNFCKLIHQLKVPIKKSEMSFSFQSEELAIEYNISDFKALLSNHANLLNTKFYRLLADILRFNQQANLFLTRENNDYITIKDFIGKNFYSKLFVDAYLTPMIAAIWSINPQKVLQMSAKFILKFFFNHGLLKIINRPQWYVVEQGSSYYVLAIKKIFSDCIRLNSKVISIKRKNDGIVVKTNKGEEIFDYVVMATHSDEALKLINNPYQIEIDILEKINYQSNEVILHYDNTVLPKNRRLWASWNYSANANELPTLTYYMNRLQSINSPIDFCVSVNQTKYINPEKIIDRFNYAHPVFNKDAVKAQQQYMLVNGIDRIYFCGAYWGYGFHEDGVNSALEVCREFGINL